MSTNSTVAIGSGPPCWQLKPTSWPRFGKTLQLHIDINDTCLLALLDSGSTHNFVDIAAADRVGIKLGG
jgi:hypothetical protein